MLNSERQKKIKNYKSRNFFEALIFCGFYPERRRRILIKQKERRIIKIQENENQ
jgi:hypothetical protein